MLPNHPSYRLGIAAIVLAIAACSPAQPGPPSQLVQPGDAAVHVAQPSIEPFNESQLSRLKVPEGFQVKVFAKGLGNPRMMAIADDGTLYVTRRETGDVIALVDADGNGQADAAPRVVATGLVGLNGITIRDSKVYLALSTEVRTADLQEDGSLATPKPLMGGLPDPGQHPSWSVAFGPDEKLYLSVGSPCNDCVPLNEAYATILRADADGQNRVIFARGLRNTIGFDWHPTTNELWGMDHGVDWRGDAQPPEELNRIAQGRHYGWPFCYGAKEADGMSPHQPPDGRTREAFCADTEPAALTYAAHAAPMAMRFYRSDQFPLDYKSDAFVTFHGSWNREKPSGYNVARLRFENGKPSKFEDFVTGFLSADGKSVFGRPCGLVQTDSGELLFTDDANGVIYQVAYTR
jgi:glucose/arabinose dehydrogenase